jgi:hypothetical protein
MVVISAAGGRIQAAAWTTRVLVGLSKRIQNFDQSVAAITATSGGSVGAMFYVRTLDSYPEKKLDREAAIRQVKESSIEQAGWGLVVPDLMRVFAPLPWPWIDRDRGWALERSLATAAELNQPRSGSPVTLRRLASQLEKGFPVLLLNATASESGRALVFTNGLLPDHGHGRILRHESLGVSQKI